MQYPRLLFAACFIAPLLLRAQTPPTQAPKVEVIEEVVAKVNGDIITNRDLVADLPPIEEEIRKRGMTGPAADEVRRGILRSRIDESRNNSSFDEFPASPYNEVIGAESDLPAIVTEANQPVSAREQ